MVEPIVRPSSTNVAIKTTGRLASRSAGVSVVVFAIPLASFDNGVFNCLDTIPIGIPNVALPIMIKGCKAYAKKKNQKEIHRRPFRINFTLPGPPISALRH